MRRPGRSPSPDGQSRREVARLLLGQAQMLGAVVAAVLVLDTGVNALSLATVGSTCLVVAASRLLFGEG